MGKRIHLILLVFITALGLAAMIYFGAQPQPTSKMDLTAFEATTHLAGALSESLQKEFKESPLLLLGLEPGIPDHMFVAKELLRQMGTSGFGYDVVVLDSYFQTTEFPEAVRISVKEQLQEFLNGTEKALSENKRVVAIVPTVFASQVIPQNLAEIYKLKTKKTPLSLSISYLPRSREMERGMLHPCVVEGVDQTGLGPFGCDIVLIARANYRKKMPSGKVVGVMKQMSAKDFLFLYSIEK